MRPRLFLLVALVVVVLSARSRVASAWAFHDGPAFAQRVTVLLQQLHQYRQIVSATKGHMELFRNAYKGSKDWKNLGWVDTLKVLDSPWLDKVRGIDEIRLATATTVLTAEQATKLWSDVKGLTEWERSARYRKDLWFRRKIDSIRRQSRRARDQRAALVRQMQSQNRALIEDVKKIQRLRDAIQAESAKSPVNQARVTSLQAELSATEAKYQGENLMLRNQQAIMFLVGEDDAYESYLEVSRSDWLDQNSTSVLDFGRGLAR